MTMEQIMNAEAHDNPGVIARPPLIYLSFLTLGIVLDLIWPAAVIPDLPQYVNGFAFIALGVALMVFCVRRFRAAGTNVETYKPANLVVAEGPYRISRNPIYLALTLIYTGIGVAADLPWVLALLLPLLAIMHYGVVVREEAYLEEKFGAEYRGYKERVRRWL